jgi:hypothetical protein
MPSEREAAEVGTVDPNATLTAEEAVGETVFDHVAVYMVPWEGGR